MPDARTRQPLPAKAVATFLSHVCRRLRTAAALDGVAAGAACVSVLLVLARVVGNDSRAPGVVSVVAGSLLAGAIAWIGSRRATSAAAAEVAERRTGVFDNLLVTAESLPSRPKPVHPMLADEILRQAGERVQRVRPADVVALRGPAALAFLLCLTAAFVGLFRADRAAQPPAGEARSEAAAGMTGGIVSLHVHVTPPRYTRLPEQQLTDPTDVRAIEGSRIDLEVVSSVDGIDVVTPDGRASRMTRDGERHHAQLVAAETRFLVLRPAGASSSGSRLLTLVVEPDRRPLVRVREPARDLAFAEPRGRVPVRIEATDDVGIESVEVRYTHITGSGEAFTFKEGTLPLAVSRATPAQWSAATEIPLERLGLEVGDTVVYRAIARDGKPGADPASSESFIVEIGETAGAATGGFALPDDRERHAISQQMVIVKTERLHATRGQTAGDAFVEQARMLAVEQRMVRAEFVFMTGGEVEDEVAEAEHSHDLVEGRFENEAQVELLAAIREMSRAESALNAGDTTTALPFERAALAALQRAFDRRRYLLRTLPERARIDPARRLSGERDEARSWSRPAATPAAPEALDAMRTLMRDLQASLAPAAPIEWAALAARVGALVPGDADAQAAALALAAAARSDVEARNAAIRSAMRLVSERAARLLASPAGLTLPRDPLAGRVADERDAGGRR